MFARTLIVLLSLAGLAACASTLVDYNGEMAPHAAAIVPLKSERRLVALALGSGGARGFAHIGVIKALEAAGVVPDIVAGSSSGAIVAALYAGGHNAAALQETALNIEKEDLVDFTLFGSGWVRGEALQEFINRALGNRPIEKLAKPFAVVVTRAQDGSTVVFNRGNAGLAVRASASVPNLFIPPVIRGEEYIDGGLTSPVPVAAARAMGADVVIAVDVSWFAQARNYGGEEVDSVRRRARHQLLERELAQADVVITPRTVRSRILDFDHKIENIAAGEEAARQAVPQLRELIARIAAQKRPLARSRSAD